jgi:SAM-dependent methyltransferase
MIDREQISSKARAFFDELWMRGDPWEFETSAFEDERFARLRKMLEARRYQRVLEIGCGAGNFTRRFAPLADQVLALDISADAIAKAQAAKGTLRHVEFRTANIMDYDPKTEGPWDLIILSETIYFLGWLYPFFDVAWLAFELFTATRAGGQLLMANSYGGPQDYLLLPFLIRTYRDLFRNIGYQINSEETFAGSKNSVEIEVLITLFEKMNEQSSGAR